MARDRAPVGSGTRDIFGRAETAEPAQPGSYGLAPAGFRLPQSVRLGPVRLQVADLPRSLAFYQEVLGLRPLSRDAAGALLAPPGDGAPLIELRERSGARPAPSQGALGLYHFAILLPDRPSLGRLFRHLVDTGTRAEAADHLVSESLYLRDPDNLGIEVYADRPRSTWWRVGRELMIVTDPLDLAGLLQAAGAARWHGMPPGTVVGHVHLHVGDLERAAAFYSDGLGFDRTTWHYPGALFLAAGGYHHHLGTNTWAGPRAAPPAADDARLLEWTMELPEPKDVLALDKSLDAGGYQTEWAREEPGKAELVTRDPWGTQLRIFSSGQAQSVSYKAPAASLPCGAFRDVRGWLNQSGLGII